MLTKEDIKRADELDAAAARAGGYINTKAPTVSYRIRDMHKYCISLGKDVEELTADEKELFRVPAKPKAL